MAEISITPLARVASGEALLLAEAGNSLLEIEHGFYLGRTDMPLSDVVTYEAESFPFAALSILLEGSITTDTSGIGELHPNAMLAVANNERRTITSRFHGASRLRNVEVFLTPDWFDAGGSRFRDETDFDPLREAMARPLRNMRLPLDPRLKAMAQTILALRSGGALAALRLEAWALDLLVELAASFHRRPTRQILAPVDRDRIHAIRDFIETDPQKVGSLAELAQSHGISASKLKRDFFLAFETCIGGFTNSQRLILARRLLEEGLSVSQTAYRIGYSHPANFSAAFKRHFGVPPRSIRG
jgi:AraC-like DNA-binding protein